MNTAQLKNEVAQHLGSYEKLAQYIEHTSCASDESGMPNNLMMIEMIGDSMAPTIYSGEQLLIDTSVMRVRQDGIYAYAINGALIVKRISLLHNGGLHIMSDNSHYVSMQLSSDQADMINIVGRVVMRFRRM